MNSLGCAAFLRLALQCNRILAFRPVLPCRQNRLGFPRFGLFTKIWLVACAVEMHGLCNLRDGVFADILE